MADNTLEGKIEALSKKIDSQARFTRGVLLLCTAAVLAVVFYTFTEILSTLPVSLLAVSENLRKVSHAGMASNPAAPAAAAAKSVK